MTQEQRRRDLAFALTVNDSDEDEAGEGLHS